MEVEEKRILLGIGAMIMMVVGIGAVVALWPKPKPPEIPPPDEPPPSETPPGVVYSMLIVTPSKVYLGESVEISVNVTNTAGTTAEYDLYLGPDTGLTAHVILMPDEAKTYTWVFTPTQTGIYDVWADNEHNMFEVTTVEEEATTPPIYGTVLYTVSDWIVYEALDGRGRVYRYSLPWSVVEFWIESDGVHRLQVKGTSPFGAWPTHHVFEVGMWPCLVIWMTATLGDTRALTGGLTRLAIVPLVPQIPRSGMR